MQTTAAGRAIRDQHGVAMVLTLFIMLILASLAMAFAMLGASEPQIAANLDQSAAAMGLAEAGIERVIWGVNNPTAPGGLAYPVPASIPAPYDGSTDIALGAGVYRVTVTAGASNVEVVVTSEGRIPNWAGYRTRRIVRATVTALPNLNPPCTLCVKTGLRVGDNTIIDSRTSTCGNKQASYSKGITFLHGRDGVTDTSQYGLFSNDANPSRPNQHTDYSQNVVESSFNSFTLTQDQLNLLKDLAKANGTYYKGAKSFSGSVPSGIIFVDTVSGNPIGNPADPLDFGSLTITGAAGATNGWIVVMGDLSTSGEWSYSGLLYAANRLTSYHAEGSGATENSLSGAIITQNVLSSTRGGSPFATSSSFSTSLTKKANIQYNCDNTRSAGGIYPAFFVKPGSWRELSG